MAKPKLTKEGTWRVQLMVGGRREGRTFRTKEAAQKWADIIKNRLQHKVMVRASCIDFALDGAPKKLLKALEDAPHSVEEILGSALPAESFCGVYFLIADGEVVYVGQSKDVFKRVSTHRSGDKQFDSFSYIACGKDDVDRLEALYIAMLMPRHNYSLARSRHVALHA